MSRNAKVLLNDDWHTIWDCIHIICKVYNPNGEYSKKAIICFFECLVDLLPDNNSCNVLDNFMKQYPLVDYLDSNENLFRWSYNLHNYVTIIKRRNGQFTLDISFENANKKYSFINKKDWGNAFWFVIHFISYNLPKKFNKDISKSFKAFIVSLRYLVPCPECSKHMHEYLSENDIEPFLIGNKELFYWTWVFHNSVNKRIGNKCPNINSVIPLYQRF